MPAERRLTKEQRKIWLERCVVIDSIRESGDISTLHGILLDLDDADEEIAAMRPVVDAACAWEVSPLSGAAFAKLFDLRDAIDAYRAAQKEAVTK